jgi:hypothetical protein
MAKRNFLIDLDLDQNELLRARIQNEDSGTPPSPGIEVSGQIYYATDLNQIGFWDGVQWQYLDTGSISDVIGDSVTGITVSVSGGIATVSGLQAGGLQDGFMTGTQSDKLDASTSSNTGDTLVERDVNGDFSANDITANSVTGLVAPTVGSDAANKTYVDSIAAGLDPKESVRVATKTDISGTYNSTGGVGGSGEFTAVDLTDGTIFDLDGGGTTIAIGDRILIKNQSTLTENGIYVVTTANATGVIERATDHDGTPSSEVSGGNFTFVETGADLESTGWVIQGEGELTLNTDNIVWVQFSQAAEILAGAGLLKTGNTIDVQATDDSITVGTDDIAVNVDNSTIVTQATTGIEVADAGITGTQLNTSVAGDGLAGGGGSALSVNIDGTTIEIISDTLTIVDSGIGVTQIDGAIAGAGLTGGDGSALSIGSDSTITVNADTIGVSNAGITETQLNTSVAGAGLAGGAGAALSVNVANGLSIDGDDVQLGGTLSSGTLITTIDGDGSTQNLEIINLDNLTLGYQTGTIQSNGSNPLNYAGDYSANYTNRSVVDKEYVDSQISAIPQGDITGVTAGDGLSGGGTSGFVTLDVNVDGSTIQIVGDDLQVANGGITETEINSTAIGSGLLGGSGAVLSVDESGLSYSVISTNLDGDGLVANGSVLDVNTDTNFITTDTDQVTIGNYTSRVATKENLSLGAGVASSVTHNFGTEYVQVALYDSTTKEEVEAYIEVVDTNTIGIVSNSTETLDVVITGNVSEILS